ncbi:DEAD/DEAH box helicase [Salinibacterium sp. SWN139]|uniref:DEAD/DEAH box helicase n=1 Tax=Salinibacterium sp. SWN139 TaxID=2792055 RepID=UPI0018CC98B5|nr:DEAD/DEAH box helicase [Salinibacterium sp. SWN139]MBH0053080.1 DEAD/DEAH box helicase [Salinibacterium sp. SWN139]
MPNFNKPATGRGNKNFNSGAPKRGGSRSEGHRGFRADEGDAPKRRWSADDRAARTGDRKPGGARGGRDERRPDWTPREKPARGGRPEAGGRGDRPSYGDRPQRNERGAYGDRPQRSNDRPSYGDRPERGGRPSYGDRNERPQRSNDRPSYGDRPDRGSRPSYNDRNDRNERPQRSNDRPSYGDRPDRGGNAGRSERPSYNDRNSSGRSERPSYNDRNSSGRNERPSYNDRNAGGRSERPSYGDRPDRGGRPSYNDRTERPSYNDRNAGRTERPSYGDRGASAGRTERPSYNDRAQRTERPAYGDRPDRGSRPERSERPAYNERPQRSERPSYGDRPDRGSRPSYSDRNDRNDRPQRSEPRESAYYPARDGKSSHSQQEDVVLERLVAKTVTASDVEGKSFIDLGIGSNISRQLASMGAESPFPIQAATIPDVLAGKDVLGRGKTGSGKTIAFGAPLVERLMENNGGKDRQMGRKPRALILAPTRELAQQIDRTIQPIARSVGLFTTTIVGGVPQYKQVAALTRGVDVIIATPGRVEDLIEQGRLDLSQVKVTVLDEADHMCDLGFLEPVQRILRETSEGGQKLLFSATLDKGVATLVNEFLVDPAVHEVAGEDQASSTIDHKVLLIEQRDKRAIIKQLSAGTGKTLVFTRTRAFAEEMAEFLSMGGTPATSLHGDLNQSRRTRNLQMLTSGKVNVLVATDVAARGIHVDDISLVIQADAPEEYKTYLHRAGRTGRAGKAGTVVTLIPRNRRRKMDELLGRAEIDAESVDVAPGDSFVDKLAAL